MNTTNEQQQVASNTADTFTRMSEVALSSIERLTALNVNMARESLQQGISASMSASRAQNGKDQAYEKQAEDQVKVQNRLNGAGVERVTAYVRDVQEIFMEAQSEFSELIQKHMSSFGMNGQMAFPGMRAFEKIAQQTSDITKANARDMVDATEKVLEKTSQGRKAA
jgi:hypothetical protein